MTFGLIATTQTANMSPARADSFVLIKHRDISSIPTLRVWDDGHDRYFDLPRGDTFGYFELPFKPSWYYIPVGWCAEHNFYQNNVLVSQDKFGYWNKAMWIGLSNEKGINSIRIYNPGADRICN